MRSVLFVALMLSLGGCATTEGVTSFKAAGDTENLHEKERRLWHEAAGYDNTIERSGQLYEHARATTYLQGVMDGLYPEFKGKIPVRIYDSTQMNAFALPNGSVYINIGMLARIENEAQLAAVLGHEAVHFIEKHSFQERVSTKNAASFAVSGIPFSSLAAMSSISGFSRELEREADATGYERLVKAGYDPRGVHLVFQHLADEVKALDIKEPYFFSSHPRMIERIEEFKRLSAQYKGGGRTGSEQYNSIMSEIRLDALRKDIGQDRYKTVILVMEDRNLKGYFPAASYYYLGEAYSRREEAGDEKKALEAYKKAEQMSPGFAPTYLRLGVHYMKKGDKGNARTYFNRYLSRAPKDASDRGYAQQYLNSL